MWPFKRKESELDKKLANAEGANEESMVRAAVIEPQLRELRKLHDENGVFRLVIDSMR